MSTQTAQVGVQPPNNTEGANVKPNSIAHLKELVSTGQVTTFWTLVMAFIRLPLILIGLGLGFLVLSIAGNPNPWSTSVSLSNVYVTIFMDGGCLLLLAWLVRREGMRLRDLLGIDRRHLLRDILLGLGLMIVLIIVFYVTTIISYVITYGPNFFETVMAQFGSTSSNKPMFVLWWSTLILPLSVGFIEEMTYRGFVLPRLVAITKHAWLAVLIMSIGFGAQHLALPLVDLQTSISRFIATFLSALIFFGPVYLKQKRLLPLVIAHWGLDFIGIGLFPLIAALSQ